jgi:3-oxoacyl-[acyl-carrier protein] reductase
MNLKNAKILITGGSSGIGYAMAHIFRLGGAQVCMTGRNAEKLYKASAELDVFRIQADVASEEDCIRSVVEAKEKMGGLNVLVNNAGYGYFDLLAELQVEKMEALLNTNVLGLVRMGKAAAQIFTEQKYGNIINISSTAGLSGFAGGTAYVASKFAVKGITECWRAELRKHNIRVMLINPSEVQTHFSLQARGSERPFNPTKMEAEEIAHLAKAMLEMRDVGFITEATVFATNPREV